MYGWAVAGIGVAVAGVAGPRWAAATVVAIVIVTALVDLLAPALRLPAWIEQLALTHHLGQPMTGRWEPAGMVACLALAVGGTVLGAWGMSRRDVAR